MITYKRTDHLLCPIRATWEEIKRLNDRMLKEKSNESGSVFLPLFKLKRSANVTSIWTLQIYVETLVCRRMEGTIPPPDTTRGRDSVWSLCWNQSIRTQGPMGREVSGLFPPHNQTIKNLILRAGGRLLHPCALCVVPWWHILSLFISDLTACSSWPLHRTVCALSYKRTVAQVASAKLEKKDTVAWTQNQQCCTDKYI